MLLGFCSAYIYLITDGLLLICFVSQINFKATANGHPKGVNTLNNSDTEVGSLLKAYGKN